MLRHYPLLTSLGCGVILLATSHCGSNQAKLNQNEPLNPQVDFPSTLIIISKQETISETAQNQNLEATVPVYSFIVWKNEDTTDHSITSPTGLWDSGRIKSGQIFSYQFREPGDYLYTSVFNPNIKGIIHVQSQ